MRIEEDKTLLTSQNFKDVDSYALFSNINKDAINISNEKMHFLCQSYSKIYEVIISEISKRYCTEFSVSYDQAYSLVRYSSVPVIFCFLDRVYRLNNAIVKSNKKFIINRGDELKPQDRIENFVWAINRDDELNQNVIYFLSKIWNIETKDGKHNYLKPDKNIGYSNFLSRIYDRNIFNGLIFRFNNLLSFFPRNRIPALSLSYAMGPFIRRGIFSNKINVINISNFYTKSNIDNKLRGVLFSRDIFNNNLISEFLNNIGLNKDQKKIATLLLQEFFIKLYPTMSLELFANNIKHSNDVLNKFSRRSIIGSTVTSTEYAYLLSQAKYSRFNRINIQHGGHYGYMDGMFYEEELEYPFFDVTVTWGWNELPKTIGKYNLKTKKLPSPWLSERKKYWKKLDINGTKKYNILFMPSTIKRYPSVPQSTANYQYDNSINKANEIYSTVEVLVKNNFKVLLKPYSKDVVNNAKSLFQNMNKQFQFNYFLSDVNGKGLTYSMLHDVNIVLWDKPGFGFLECIACNIPTMVYWSREFENELPNAKKYFKELSDVGVVHNNFETLIYSVNEYIENPKIWVNNSQRIFSINRFKDKYCKTSSQWYTDWSCYFDSL